MEQQVRTDRKDTWEITVIRCGCGNPDKIHPGEPCPSPRKVRNLGVVSYNHEGHPWKSRLFTALIWLKRRLINDR